jgi:DNA-binding beta-propeller fold protein YncE
MRNLAGLLIVGAVFAGDLGIDSVQFRHECTYGSKDGIRPPRASNKKWAVAATGKGDFPYGLGFPVAVATDLRHRVWITDSATASVHVFDRETGAYREIRRCGDSTLVRPDGIATDRQGRMYIADSELANVFVFEDGEYTRALIKRGQHTLTAPTTIAFSENERTIYVADPPRNLIVALDREGEVDGTIPLTEATRDPIAIHVINNQIYVLGGRQHRVEIFSPAGQRRGELRWDGVAIPTAFTYDESKRRFLVANPRLMIVEVFGMDGRNIGAFGQRGDRVDQQQRIESLHIDRQGVVYIVDSHQGKVLLFREPN